MLNHELDEPFDRTFYAESTKCAFLIRLEQIGLSQKADYTEVEAAACCDAWWEKAAKLACGCEMSYLHLVRRFWNQVLTCASVIFRLLARAARSALARYFCRWKRFSSSQIWTLEKEVRGFFRFGGVRFWYGCPIRRVTANGTRAAEADKTREERWEER